MDFNLTGFQKDALKELGNIGAGNAATALSQLIGKDISLDVPEVIITPVENIINKIKNKTEIVVAVYLRVFGEIPSQALLIFPNDKIFLFLSLLMKKDINNIKEFGDTEQSAIKEVGNIIISAYLNAIAKFIGLNSVPSVPSLAVDMVDAIFETVSVEIADSSKKAILIENSLKEEKTQISCSLYLMPETEAMEKILTALNDTMRGT